MTSTWSATLLRRQLDHAFVAARWHVDSLDDDEYLWEPAPGAWTIRRNPSGQWVLDDAWPPPDPVPVTSIAWRIAHLVGWTEVYRDWTFGAASLGYSDVAVAGTATDAVSGLEHAQAAFGGAIAPLTDGQCDEVRPVHYGGVHPVGLLVWQIAVEHLHHGAEIGVLRDLHRGHARTDWWPEPTDF